MNDSIEGAREGMQRVRGIVHLSMTITSAKNGNDESMQLLREPQTIEGEFPGTRQRAMGHALVIEEDLEELGISCEREYIGEVEGFDDLHRVDIHIEGGSTEEGGA